MFNLTADVLDANRPTSSSDLGTRYIWDLLIKTSGTRAISEMLDQLGAKSLTSQILLDSGVQSPLPQNQWQLDVTNWWYTALAAAQIEYVETAVGTTDPELREVEWVPLNDREQKLCNSQVCSTRNIQTPVSFKAYHASNTHVRKSEAPPMHHSVFSDFCLRISPAFSSYSHPLFSSQLCSACTDGESIKITPFLNGQPMLVCNCIA